MTRNCRAAVATFEGIFGRGCGNTNSRKGVWWYADRGGISKAKRGDLPQIPDAQGLHAGLFIRRISVRAGASGQPVLRKVMYPVAFRYRQAENS